MIRLELLENVPDTASLAARWIFDQFPHEFYGVLFEDWLEVFRAPERTVVIALNGDTPVATASLDPEDLPVRPDLGPWLASVFVQAEYRAHGIGAMLTARVENEARKRGVTRLYLHTTDREAFYARRGWQTLERVTCWNRQTAVMVKDLLS
jgi:GNAT superfamily N-acetyltransferase